MRADRPDLDSAGLHAALIRRSRRTLFSTLCTGGAGSAVEPERRNKVDSPRAASPDRAISKALIIGKSLSRDQRTHIYI